MSGYSVILFYKYVNLPDPLKVKEEQLLLCTKLNLKGRIILAEEGINATLEGTNENIKEYCDCLLANDLFRDIHIKRSSSSGTSLPRLIVKVRPEIVASKLSKEIDPTKATGKYLPPETLKAWIDDGKDFQIVDMRNDYEFKSGHFAGSIPSGMKNFRDIKDVPQKLSDLKEKTIVAVCTGGIRCEKASANLLAAGWKHVYQLEGGIVTYMEKYPSHAFKGTLYVFDNRITMDFDDPDKHIVVGKCEKCLKSSENYINCANDNCHIHFICCKGCLDASGRGFCSSLCEKAYESQSLEIAGKAI